jgi:8-oxo-dGTP diphosphatase
VAPGVPQSRLPFDERWADDALWLLCGLAGERVRGRFVFDGDTMIEHELLDVEQDRDATPA